jgi:hypothetical protein
MIGVKYDRGQVFVKRWQLWWGGKGGKMTLHIPLFHPRINHHPQ